MAGAAGTAAGGVNTVHLPAREGKASGGQPGGRRDESLAGGRRGPWRSPAASRKDRPSLGEPERSPLRGYLLELSPSMVSVRRDLGRAGVFGASEWCRGLGDLWVRCVSVFCVYVWVSCRRVAACHDLQDLSSLLSARSHQISHAMTRGRVTRGGTIPKFPCVQCGPACGCAGNPNRAVMLRR